MANPSRLIDSVLARRAVSSNTLPNTLSHSMKQSEAMAGPRGFNYRERKEELVVNILTF